MLALARKYRPKKFSEVAVQDHVSNTLKGAIAAGYDRAFGTIFDSHVTTLISSIILIFMGTGSVKGFGVALTIGVAASLFTAQEEERRRVSRELHDDVAQKVSILEVNIQRLGQALSEDHSADVSTLLQGLRQLRILRGYLK